MVVHITKPQGLRESVKRLLSRELVTTAEWLLVAEKQNRPKSGAPYCNILRHFFSLLVK